MSNYVIAIGGSGSRSVESLIHLCAAGLGPKDLKVIFIDPDNSNGNLTKAQEVLAEYMNTRKILVENGIRPKEGEFYFTDFGDITNNHWGIFENNNNTLERFINYAVLSESEKQFIKTLYSNQELNAPLDEGFRGHPSIGALVMALVNFEREPWTDFWQNVHNLSGERSTKVFIFGSIFGGTGAAGLPTIAKKIKGDQNIQLGNGRSKVDLGGALLLPYFTFELPREGTEGMYVTVNDFPIAAKSALKFYSQDDNHFDDIYLLGEVTENNLGTFSTGTQTQRNRSHYLELIAAFASLDFFHTVKSPTDTQKRVFLSARVDNNQINWSEIPYSREGNTNFHGKTLRGVETLTTFLYAIEKFFNDSVFKDIQDSAKYNETWYRSIFNDGTSLKEGRGINPKVTAATAQLIKFRALYLRWMSEISTNNGRVEVKLFNIPVQNESWDRDVVGNLISSNRVERNKLDFLKILLRSSQDASFKTEVKNSKEPFYRLYSLTRKTTYEFLR